MDCQCWVSKATEEIRFGTRWGAHNPACPVYRPSGDIVDAKYDNLQRMDAERNA